MPPFALVLRALAAILALVGFVATAGAQLRWDGDGSAARADHVAGRFDYYALVLSWSPTHCSTPEAADDQLQCNRRDGRRYAFVLHGLWPQYERGYPESCRTARRPFVPDTLIDGMLDVMPSRGLIIHEYRKHGTCSGLDPAGYFKLSRQLFQTIKIPQRYRNPFETQYVSPRDLQREFAAANPGLPAEAIAVGCARGNRGRLREIRICFSKDGAPRACGVNENQAKLCSAAEMAVPPVRSSHFENDIGAGARRSPLPGPR